MANPTAGPPVDVLSKETETAAEGSKAEGGAKEVSKRAAAKAAKKAAAAAKKAELALRPKEKPAESVNTTPTSMFDQGWLKAVYEEKKVPHVYTRFPPEPNGFLHIGHAKAIAVNFGFAKRWGGDCYLRFDDTNPEKEESIYFQKIKEMVEWLGFKPYKITHSSDYFDRLYELAEELIRRDKAYVCHCSKEEINMQRGGPDNKGKRYACAHRERPTEESLAEFRAMRDGKYKPGEAFLRMKQSLTDPNEGNPQMHDLPAYRILDKPHPQTGDKWRIYPLYDFAHCICDQIENISHSLCTVEFFQSRVSYNWLLEELDLKKRGSDEVGPMQREYGRLNVEGTILSKRRIQLLVKGGEFALPNGEIRKVPPAVRGWDDPRLYTLIALRRRGIPAQALLNFVSELGVTTANTNIQTFKLEASVRKYLERTVPRLMLVLNPIKIVIEDLPEDFKEDLTIPFDPKDASKGSRTVTLERSLYIEQSDFQSIHSPEFFRLTPEQPVGLLNVPFAVKYVGTGDDGILRVARLEGVKPKAYIHWVPASLGLKVRARQYNALFTVDEPNTLDWKSGGYADSLNPNSEVEFSNAIIEPAFKELISKKENGVSPTSGASDDIVRFQAVRTAYFAVDPVESEADGVILNQIVTLKEDSKKGK
ncbi:glutamine-tRNA ligase [Verruconis gallopava]|uniref:glutamine--tRNA ligase n=1 Tax=Verruconis gallopava TaxID=253628 RepID=A0A0D1XCY8_9PEZI|nr:glutamine-tRNA ligase [Verruconis gallopava]KIW00091.1 glutamine-tRNA ligase [Verruconis gallopava]